VTSLFNYSGFHRDLLLRAKDLQDPVAVEAFAELYSEAACKSMNDILSREDIGTVVIPRLSFKRILGMNWHPSDFWLHQLEELESKYNVDRKLEIFMPLPRSAGRRANISSFERRQKVSQRAHLSLKSPPAAREPILLQEDEAGSEKGILLVDDVLTSGGTLLSEMDFFTSVHFASRISAVRPIVGQARVLPPRLNAHILTLFRTPMSGAKKG
jgi:predicted amidophosphoribosyltransferase